MGALEFGPIQCKGVRLRFLVYDLEWYPHSMKVRLCGVYDGKRYRYYTTVADFLDGELTSANRGAVFFAHAGGLSDVQYVLEEIIRRNDPDISVDVSFSGSSAVIVRVKKGKNAWTFADSYWVLKAPLREIGELVGMSKGGASESLEIFYAPLPVLVEYNAGDCKILYMALRQFEDETIRMGGELRLTIASCAMYLFRAAFLQRVIPTHGRVNDLARKAYVASRVEVFDTMCGEARMYDINSSFPMSMTYPLPGRMLCSTRSLNVPRVGGVPLYGGESCYLAELTIRVPETYIPPLPKREGGRVYFPTGEWTGWFTTPDVEALYRIPGARIIRVHEVIHFEPFSDMKDYISILYEKKAEATRLGKLFRAIVFKYYLNTLYGKTAESRMKESLVIGACDAVCHHKPQCRVGHDGRLPCIRMIRPGVFLRSDEVAIAHEWVPIAAHVTARSRLAHFDLLTLAKRPIYGDTDCAVMPVEYGTLPTGEELGALKMEKEIKKGEFLAPKLYMLEPGEPSDGAIRKRMTKTFETEEEARKALMAPVIKAKGFRRLTPEEFERLSSGDPVWVGRMRRVKETLSGDSVSPSEYLYLKSLRRTLRPKRAPVGETGTRPWTVEEIASEWNRNDYDNRLSGGENG